MEDRCFICSWFRVCNVLRELTDLEIFYSGVQWLAEQCKSFPYWLYFDGYEDVLNPAMVLVVDSIRHGLDYSK